VSATGKPMASRAAVPTTGAGDAGGAGGPDGDRGVTTTPTTDAAATDGARRDSTRPGWPVLAGLALLALVVRLAYWWTMRGEPLRSDAGNYDELATAIADGRGLSAHFPGLVEHATAWRPPLFPYVLGGIYKVVGAHQETGRAVGVAIGLVVVVLTAVVVSRWAGRLAGVVAAACVAVYPPLVANDIVPLSEGFSLALLLGLVHTTLARRWAWAGVLCGALMLTRPSAQALVVVLAVWFLVKVGWRAALGSTAIALCVIAPWIVRNAIVVGEPTLVTSNGFNLAAMYSPQAQAASGFVDPVFDSSFDGFRLSQLDEAGWDRDLRTMALENLRRDPMQVPQVVVRNAGYFFEITPAGNETAEYLDGRNLSIRKWTMPLFYAVTVAGLAGLWLERRTDLAQLLVVVAVTFTLASLVFVAPPRLRAPIDLVLCVGVGLLAARMAARRNRSRADRSVIDLRAQPAPPV